MKSAIYSTTFYFGSYGTDIYTSYKVPISFNGENNTLMCLWLSSGKYVFKNRRKRHVGDGFRIYNLTNSTVTTGGMFA